MSSRIPTPERQRSAACSPLCPLRCRRRRHPPQILQPQLIAWLRATDSLRPIHNAIPGAAITPIGAAGLGRARTPGSRPARRPAELRGPGTAIRRSGRLGGPAVHRPGHLPGAQPPCGSAVAAARHPTDHAQTAGPISTEARLVHLHCALPQDATAHLAAQLAGGRKAGDAYCLKGDAGAGMADFW